MPPENSRKGPLEEADDLRFDFDADNALRTSIDRVDEIHPAARPEDQHRSQGSNEIGQ
jgi:hypothetical protein